MADDVDEYGLAIWGAPERNKEPILNELLRVLPSQGGLFLEVSSATGQHAEHFARGLPHFSVQTSDYDPEHLKGLQARQNACGLENFLPPLHLDVLEASWPVASAAVIFSANMLHIAPIEAVKGLFSGAGNVLSAGGLLITYGPYQVGGMHTSPSNERFDASLRERNPSWGIRDLDMLRQTAALFDLQAREPVQMPANNFLVVWDKVR